MPLPSQQKLVHIHRNGRDGRVSWPKVQPKKRRFHMRCAAVALHDERQKSLELAVILRDALGLADTSWNYLCAARCLAWRPTAKETTSTGRFRL